jgi:hypothetical protein
MKGVRVFASLLYASAAVRQLEGAMQEPARLLPMTFPMTSMQLQYSLDDNPIRMAQNMAAYESPIMIPIGDITPILQQPPSQVQGQEQQQQQQGNQQNKNRPIIYIDRRGQLWRQSENQPLSRAKAVQNGWQEQQGWQPVVAPSQERIASQIQWSQGAIAFPTWSNPQSIETALWYPTYNQKNEASSSSFKIATQESIPLYSIPTSSIHSSDQIEPISKLQNTTTSTSSAPTTTTTTTRSTNTTTTTSSTSTTSSRTATTTTTSESDVLPLIQGAWEYILAAAVILLC